MSPLGHHGCIHHVCTTIRFRKYSRPSEPTMFLLLPNVLANLRQVSGAVRANANINHRARTVTDTARRQVQRFVRPHRALRTTCLCTQRGPKPGGGEMGICRSNRQIIYSLGHAGYAHGPICRYIKHRAFARFLPQTSRNEVASHARVASCVIRQF